MTQKDIERKARQIARKKVKQFLESEELMTLQKEDKPERKEQMKDIFDQPEKKQKDNEQEMTFEKEYKDEKLEQLKKLLHTSKEHPTKPIEAQDEGTGLDADMTFAKEERKDNKDELDELFNTDVNNVKIDDMPYDIVTADDFASILGESKTWKKIMEEEEEDVDLDVDDDDIDIDVDEETEDEDTDEEEKPELPETDEEESEEDEEDNTDVNGLVLSDDMLDELVDKILDKFDELGLVVISTDDMDDIADEINDKLEDETNVLSDDELEETISYQVTKALNAYKKITESLLKRKWENFIREMENGKLEPAKVGEVKSKKVNENKQPKENHPLIEDKIKNLSVNTKIKPTPANVKKDSLTEDKYISMLFEDEKLF